MVRVFVGIGSNIERERHVRAAVAALRAAFGPLQVSRVFEAEPVGFESDSFFNLVVAFETDRSLAEVADELRRIERAQGRRPEEKSYTPRRLDLDLLTYGDLVCENSHLQVPRDDILKFAFVLWPLAELAPEDVHPLEGRTYAELWQAFGRPGQTLRPVPFDPDPQGCDDRRNVACDDRTGDGDW